MMVRNTLVSVRAERSSTMNVRAAAFAISVLFTLLSAPDALSQTAAAAGAPHAGEMGYLNGGIGEEQAELMRDLSPQFPIRFTFSQHDPAYDTDEFVADVHLRVVDSAGRTVLDLADQGPIFLLRLPNGDYTVEAARHGEVKTRRFRISADRHAEIGFSWAG